MVRTSRLAARLLASADTKQLEKGLYSFLLVIIIRYYFLLLVSIMHSDEPFSRNKNWSVNSYKLCPTNTKNERLILIR